MFIICLHFIICHLWFPCHSSEKQYSPAPSVFVLVWLLHQGTGHSPAAQHTMSKGRKGQSSEVQLFCDCWVICGTLQFSTNYFLFLSCYRVWSLGPTLFLCYLRLCLKKISISQMLKISLDKHIVQLHEQLTKLCYSMMY